MGGRNIALSRALREKYQKHVLLHALYTAP